MKTLQLPIVGVAKDHVMLLLLPHAGEAMNLSHPVSVDLLEDEDGGEVLLGEQLHGELLPHGVSRSDWPGGGGQVERKQGLHHMGASEIVLQENGCLFL